MNVTFESWVIELAAKFRIDGGTFLDELARVHYAARFVQGAPKAAIEPRLRSANRPFTRVAELIQVLETGFRDTNLEARSRRQLSRLRFNPRTDKIGPFIAHFNALAEDGQLALPLLKQALFDTLPASINMNVAHHLRNEAMTYERFCVEVAWTAEQVEENEKDSPKTEGSSKNKSTSTRESGRNRSARMDGNIGTWAPTKGRPDNSARWGANFGLSENEVERLRAQGACFFCKRRGHRALDCPSRQGGATPTRSATTQARTPGPVGAAAAFQYEMEQEGSIDESEGRLGNE